MYNKQLKTFLTVAECQSFHRAAEVLYISASAVIQQINNLERDLSVQLFLRNRRGLQLTEAGEFLVKEAEEYIRQGERIRSRLLEIETQKPVIRVGTSLDEKSTLLYALWLLFTPQNKKYDVRLVFSDTGFQYNRQAELIESIRDDAPWQEGWDFLEVLQIPWALAVGRGHALRGKTHITQEEMRQYPILLIDRSVKGPDSAIQKKLTELDISYEVRAGWTAELVWECTYQGKMMLVPSSLGELLFNMEMIPCDLDLTLPYGFFSRKDAGTPTREFVEFIRNLYDGSDPDAILPVL